MDSRYSHCHRDSEYSAIPIYHLEAAITRSIPSFSESQRLDPEMDLDKAADRMANSNDFAWSLYFDPTFLVRLMFSGFLPICTDLSDSLYCLLPKLHRRRAVMNISTDSNLHVSRKVRKHAHKYRLFVNRDFEAVVDGIKEQHGESCWLFPPLVNALTDLALSKFELPKECPVGIFSIELYTVDDDRLVAGEIGYTVGSIYTSMTGFYRDSGSGSIQLAALGGLLKRRHFSVWDFGMMMQYKRDLGCREIPRSEFIDTLRRERNKRVCLKPSIGQDGDDDYMNVSNLIREVKTSPG